MVEVQLYVELISLVDDLYPKNNSFRYTKINDGLKVPPIFILLSALMHCFKWFAKFIMIMVKNTDDGDDHD